MFMQSSWQAWTRSMEPVRGLMPHIRKSGMVAMPKISNRCPKMQNSTSIWRDIKNMIG